MISTRVLVLSGTFLGITIGLLGNTDAGGSQDVDDPKVVRLANAVTQVTPGPDFEVDKREQYAEQLAKAFLEGNAELVETLLAPYSKEPRSGVSRELLLAVLHLNGGDARQGRVALEQAALQTPDYPEVYAEFGRLAFREKRFSDALAQFEKVERLTKAGDWSQELGDHFRVRYLDGFINAAMVQRRLAEAEELLRDLKKVAPDEPSVYKRLAEVAYAQDDLEAARGHFKDLKRLMPTAPVPELQLARLAIQRNQRDIAADMLEEVERRYSKDQDIMLVAARFALEMDDPNSSDRILGELTDEGEPSDAIKLLLGQTSYMLGDYALASRYFEGLSQNNPLNPGFASLYALALAADGNADRKNLARQVALKNLQANRQRYEVISVAGWIEYSIGNRADGEELLQRLNRELVRTGLAVDRDTAYFLAVYQADQGNKDDAIKLLSDATGTHGVFLHNSQAKALLEKLESDAP